MALPDSLSALASNKADDTLQQGDHATHHNALANAVNALEQTIGPGVHNILAYGATNDLSVDSTAAFDSAKAAIVAAGGGVLVVPEGVFRAAVDFASVDNLTVIGGGSGSVIHNTTASDDALAFTDCDNLIVHNLRVQGTTGTRDGIHLERCPRASVTKIYCQGTGRNGVYAEECIGIDVDAYVGIDVTSPYPTDVTNCTGGVVLTWDGVNTDSGSNQFRLGGWYVIGKDRGWAVEIVRAEGGAVDSIIPELSKGGIKLDTCQNLILDGYYGEANPSDVEYSTGTVSVTNGDTTVTGSGTAWNTSDGEGNKNAMVGKFLIVGTTYGRIASITSDTEIELESAWAGSTASGQSYTMMGVDLYLKSSKGCRITGRGGGAVLLEGSNRNVLNVLTERLFADANSHRNEGVVITNRASATTSPVRLVDSGDQNSFRQLNYQTNALVKTLAALVGTAASTGVLTTRVAGDSANRGVLRADGGLECGDGTNARDTTLTRAAAAIWAVSNAFQFPERSDPSAPSANNVVVYAKDNGSGKTQLVARFPTGAVQVIATEP